MKKKVLAVVLACGFGMFSLVEANESENESEKKWAVGLAAVYSPSPYKSYDDKVRAAFVPMYEGKRFYIQGNEAGVRLWEKGPHKVEMGLSYHDFKFDPKDTKNTEMKMLDKRKITIMMNASYTYTGDCGIVKLQASRDLLGRSDGFLADLSYRYPVVDQKKLKVLSGVGVEWANKNQNDYYFGVSASESYRSGLSRYEAGSGITPYLTVEVKYDISKRWSAFAVGRVHFLNSEVKDSPMVGKSTTTSVAGGMLYSF